MSRVVAKRVKKEGPFLWLWLAVGSQTMGDPSKAFLVSWSGKQNESAELITCWAVNDPISATRD